MPYPLPDAPAGVDAGAWAATVAEVRAYCGWHIAPVVTETLTLDGPGGHLLVLPTLRLVDLLSVTNEGHAVVETGARGGAVQGLAARVGVPVGAGVGREVDVRHREAGPLHRAAQRLVEHGAGEGVGRRLGGLGNGELLHRCLLGERWSP